jgi:hypothetical protein
VTSRSDYHKNTPYVQALVLVEFKEDNLKQPAVLMRLLEARSSRSPVISSSQAGIL